MIKIRIMSRRELRKLYMEYFEIRTNFKYTVTQVVISFLSRNSYTLLRNFYQHLFKAENSIYFHLNNRIFTISIKKTGG